MAQASELSLDIPDLNAARFDFGAFTVSGWYLLLWCVLIMVTTLAISVFLGSQIRALPAHKSMLAVAEIIFQTCKTYLIQQAKFLMLLFALIAAAMTYYLMALQAKGIETVLLVLLFSVVGMIWHLWRGLVWDPHQHLCQCPNRLCLAAGRSLGCGQHSPASRHVHRVVPGFHRAAHDGVHPPLRAAGHHGLLLSLALPWANRWELRLCGLRAGSSPKSPTLVPT